MSESSMLKHLERELGVAMQLKQDQRDRLANKLMADSLCPTIIDEAREALAELLFYVSVRNGINPAALNQDSTIQTILNEDRKLNKAVETIYNTRKTEAIQTIKQKEAQ
jgi:hypothetical protein